MCQQCQRPSPARSLAELGLMKSAALAAVSLAASDVSLAAVLPPSLISLAAAAVAP